AVVPDFPEPDGGIVSGFVRKGTGEPLPFAPVELRESFLDDFFQVPIEIVTGLAVTDANGFYRFDFVGVDDIGPFHVRPPVPETACVAQRFSSIFQDGEQRRIDLLMLGLGRVTGRVVDCVLGALDCMPVPKANVTVTSLTDESSVEVVADDNGFFTANNVAV